MRKIIEYLKNGTILNSIDDKLILKATLSIVHKIGHHCWFNVHLPIE